MQYLLMIYQNENAPTPDRTPEQMQEYMGAWMAYTQSLKDEGIFVAGDALHPTPTATTVRLREGAAVTLDGPFAETKEHLGGYYLVNVADRAQAEAAASRCPGLQTGCAIEVREIMVF